MFTHYRTRGFILKKTDREEADRLFTFYTEDFGKLEILAKAVRKIKSKLRAGLEIFYLSEIEFIQGKTYKTLTDVVLINSFKNLRKDLTRLNIAYVVSEVFDKFIKGQEPDERIWRLLEETFEKLAGLKIDNYKLKIIYYYFFWNLLSLLGYQPDLYYCSFCQKKLLPENIYFDLKEKGMLCARCQKKENLKDVIALSPDVIKIIRILLKKDWSVLERLKIADGEFTLLKKISNYYLSEDLS